jgi:hypothetical protein
LHRLSWLVPCGFALFFFDFIYLLSLGGGAAGPWLIGVSLVSLAAIPIRSILLLMTVSMLCGYILFDRMKRTYEAWLNAELAGPTPTLCFAEDAITVDEVDDAFRIWTTKASMWRQDPLADGRGPLIACFILFAVVHAFAVAAAADAVEAGDVLKLAIWCWLALIHAAVVAMFVRCCLLVWRHEAVWAGPPARPRG